MTSPEELQAFDRLLKDKFTSTKNHGDDPLDFFHSINKIDRQHQKFTTKLKEHNLSIQFDSVSFFLVSPLDDTKKYDARIQLQLQIFLNNLYNKYVGKDTTHQRYENGTMLKTLYTNNYYFWIENPNEIKTLYSFVDYKLPSYYAKRLYKYNQDQANFLNGYDTLKSVKKEVQPALTVKEQETKILNKKKSIRSKRKINQQVEIYESETPFIITDPTYTAEQQTLIYTFIAIAQKKSLINKDLIDKYLEWYKANEKSKNYRMIAPVERIIATYKEQDFFEMVGLKLSSNGSKNQELINDWIKKTAQTLKEIYNQPFYLRYIKKKDNHQNEIILEFKLDINTAPYILNIKGLQYEIIQGYFNAKKEIDQLKTGKKKTALYDIINFKVKAITEYKNEDYLRKQITDFISAKSEDLKKNDIKQFREDAKDITNLITIKNKRLTRK